MYLTKDQLTDLLSLGKSVEQWVGVDNSQDYTVLKWLRLDRETDGSYSVAYFEVFDDGNEEFLDIYEFEAVDPDEAFGHITICSSFQDALAFCEVRYGCSDTKFVSGGQIQEEYKRYINPL